MPDRFPNSFTGVTYAVGWREYHGTYADFFAKVFPLDSVIPGIEAALRAGETYRGNGWWVRAHQAEVIIPPARAEAA